MTWKKFALQDSAQVFSELESSAAGLSSRAASERLLAAGARSAPDSSFLLWRLIKRRARSSFLYLLLAAGGLSYVLGERLEAGLILLFILINVGLEISQEYHSEKAMRLLKQYIAIQTRVRRNGQVLTVASTDIVSGDVVLIETGDRLPADMRLLVTCGLQIDESIITGESAAVEKQSALLAVSPAEMYQAKNIGFAGTTVTAGSGVAIVFATGRNVALGDLAMLSAEDDHKTEFEKGLADFNRFILKLVLLTLSLVFFANVLIKGDALNIAELLVFSLVLAVSVVPEALPVIVTVALSRGSLRLAQKKVIVKRLSAIENLGSVEVLCTDKTGTLTENLLAVNEVWARNPAVCLILALGAAQNNPKNRGQLQDAFDLALWRKLSTAERGSVASCRRIDIIPFDPERRRNSVLLQMPEGNRVLVVRGAPEEILRLSKNVDAYTAKSLLEWMHVKGRQGMRVLAVARKPFPRGQRLTLYAEQQLEFLGLIAFSDQIKSTTKATFEKARALNIQVKIITGDSPAVAGAVGYAVGLLKRPTDVLSGQELFSLPHEKRVKAILKGAVFARISPSEKYEMIKILRQAHTVGFLGEGINDAPALQLADVGLVGQDDSDIAREAADVVLLQKSLDTVIDGIKEGRTIFANILKYLKITLTSNFGNFYSIALASLFLPFVPLLPIQILLLNLLSDFPMLALATDTVDAEEMEKPKNYQVHAVVLAAILLGGVSSLFDFMLFGAFAKVSPEALQTAWFVLSLITEVVLIFSLRTHLSFFRARRPSFSLLLLAALALGTAVTLPFTTFGENVFHFIRPDASFIIIIGSLSLGYFVMTEFVKRWYVRHLHDTAALGGKSFVPAGAKH